MGNELRPYIRTVGGEPVDVGGGGGGEEGGGGNTPNPVLVINDELSGASISGNWDVTTPTDSTITVVSDRVRLHAPAGGDQRPSLVWNQNLFGVRPWYWRYYVKRLTTDIAYKGTYLAVGFRRTDGQSMIFSALAWGENQKKELWGFSTDSLTNQFMEIFIDECWVDCFWNARKLYVRRSSNAENDVPGHNDWTEVVAYDTHTVLRQMAPAEFFIELRKFNGVTVEATYEISRITLTDGGPPDAQ
jgi:hypothetical protein